METQEEGKKTNKFGLSDEAFTTIVFACAVAVGIIIFAIVWAATEIGDKKMRKNINNHNNHSLDDRRGQDAQKTS